jgi:ribosomal protein L37AE/L43A
MNCPTCNRPMRPKTARTPENAWWCEYCEEKRKK